MAENNLKRKIPDWWENTENVIENDGKSNVAIDLGDAGNTMDDESSSDNDLEYRIKRKRKRRTITDSDSNKYSDRSIPLKISGPIGIDESQAKEESKSSPSSESEENGTLYQNQEADPANRYYLFDIMQSCSHESNSK